MSREAHWSDLRVGLAAIAAAAAIVFGILFFGRLGRLPGETYRVFVQAEDARGIIRGSDVWLAGQKIGAVRDISFLPAAAGADARVLLEVELVERHRQALRRNSSVEIRSGGSLIGAPVVYLGVGTPESPVIAAGDTLRATQSRDLEGLTDRLDRATAQLPELVENATALMTLAAEPEGTLGAFVHERGGDDARQARARMAAIAARVRNRQGTVGLALADRAGLAARARLAMSRADSIRQLLASGDNSLGRFRRDSTIRQHITDLRNELSIVRALLASPDGTIGRLAQDSAIVAAVAEVEREMAALLADVKRRPLRYLSF